MFRKSDDRSQTNTTCTLHDCRGRQQTNKHLKKRSGKKDVSDIGGLQNMTELDEDKWSVEEDVR